MNKKQKDIIKIIEAKTGKTMKEQEVIIKSIEAKTGKTMKEIVTELKKELIKRNAIKI